MNPYVQRLGDRDVTIYFHKLTTNASGLTVYVKTSLENLTPEVARMLMLRQLGLSDDAIPSAEIISITPASSEEIRTHMEQMTIPVTQNHNGENIIYFVKPSWNTRVCIVSPIDLDGHRDITFVKIPTEIEKLQDPVDIREFCQYVADRYSNAHNQHGFNRPWTDALQLPAEFLRKYGMEVESTNTCLTVMQ